MTHLHTFKSGAIGALGLLLLAGCGGGGGSSSGDASNADSTVASRGVITGFGSVYVNQVRYHTDGTRFSVDDRSGKESDLKVGMIVTVSGTTQSNGEGHASSITYDNELKGPVSAITPDPLDASRKTLTILGQSVLVTAGTTIDKDGGLTFATIALNDVLEVSGFVTNTGLTATHIELQDDDDEIEIRGHIENLTATTFTIKGFPISYDGNTELDDIDSLKNGLFVEVEGQLNGAGTVLIAEEIEREDEGLDDQDEVEIEGVISAYNAGDKTFMLQGQRIDASNAGLEPASLTLADGLTVEAEGRIVSGVLIAHKIKQRGNKIKIDATLSAVDTVARTVSFNFNGMSVTIRVHAGTEIEDDDSGNDLLLEDLSAGHFVELEAFAESAGVINASEIERTDADDVRVKAAVESFDAPGRSITMLGIDFDLTAAKFEDDNDNNLSAAQFFAALNVGDFVKLKDKDSNGVFDKAELDD